MSKRAAPLIAVCIFGALVLFFRSFWLTQVGYAVQTRPAAGLSSTRSEAILIPNADHVVNDTCAAMLEQAASLSAATGGKPIFMTCPLRYGASNCELAAAAAVRDGRAITIRRIDTRQLPDTDEAEMALQRLKQSNVRAVAVVLPKFKTQRLGGWYRRVAGF